MEFDGLCEFLLWDSRGSDLDVRVHDGHIDLSADALGSALARIEQWQPGLGRELQRDLAEHSDRELLRILLAPETNHRIFWPEASDVAEVAGFLADASLAERVLRGDAPSPGRTLWTALGDFGITRDGRVLRAATLPGGGLVDFDSPFATSQRGAIPTSHRGRIVGLLSDALTRIEATSATVHRVVVAFNKSLTAKRTRSRRRSFWSSSPEKYIGRSVLWNPDLASVDLIDLAEALVHESIHTLLDMDERGHLFRRDMSRSWVRDLRLYDGADRTCSPWTGAGLPLPTFLHACFVWFGLLTFWCRAVSGGTFELTRARARVAECLRGFSGMPLLRQLDPYRECIRVDILASIDHLQSSLRRTIDAEGLAG